VGLWWRRLQAFNRQSQWRNKNISIIIRYEYHDISYKIPYHHIIIIWLCRAWTSRTRRRGDKEVTDFLVRCTLQYIYAVAYIHKHTISKACGLENNTTAEAATDDRYKQLTQLSGSVASTRRRATRRLCNNNILFH